MGSFWDTVHLAPRDTRVMENLSLKILNCCMMNLSQSRPPSIYKPLKETSRWLFSLGWKRGHRTLPSEHRTLDSLHPVHWSWPRVRPESRVSDPNGHLRLSGRSAGPHRTCPVHTGLMRREFRKPAGHRTLSTGSVRCPPDPCAERVAKHPHTGR